MRITVKKIDLQKGYYFSPGFYMNYWVNCIEKYYPAEVIKSHVKLKSHREVFIGAILAAWLTKSSGIKHYAGLPEREPPDVEVVKFSAAKTPKGRDGMKAEKMGFEITRCSIDEGESIIEQIKRKNKPAYSGMSLVVYTYGGPAVDFAELNLQVNEFEIVYPAEILIVGPIIGTRSIIFEPGTYGITGIYPKKSQSTVNIGDGQAFFMYQSIRTITGLGVRPKPEDLGYGELMPPEIST